jgi:hypothetical protein
MGPMTCVVTNRRYNTRMSDRRVVIVTAALVLAAGLAVTSAQPAAGLSALTVPVTSLPEGCALAPAPALPSPFVLSDGTEIQRSPYPGKFPQNPWVGTEDRYKTQVQHIVEPAGAIRMPDGPPLDQRQANKLSWAGRGRAAEAYHAIYQDSAGASIVVQAVRFHDVKAATAIPQSPNRIVRGSTVIKVDANRPTGCLNAVLSYLQSLK